MSSLQRYKILLSTLVKCALYLATFDHHTGVYLAAVVIPNIFWTLTVTSGELERAKKSLENSAQSKLGATLILWFFTSNMYQLALISVIRLYGMLRPWQSGRLTPRHILIMLILTWVFALIVAILPSENCLR